MTASAKSIYEHDLKSIDGEPANLSEHKGKVILMVNVASRCGFTRQYQGLEELYNKYKDKGLVVCGFPCNQFGGQEPGTEAEIKEFCSTKFGVKFEILEKVHAKGKTTEPYTTLNNAEPKGDVEWNFEKFLVGKDSKVIARFKPGVKPFDENLIAAIEVALDS